MYFDLLEGNSGSLDPIILKEWGFYDQTISI